MTVPDEIRKCVAFVAMRLADETFKFVGSGFFVGRDAGGNMVSAVHFVTARHVIDGIRSTGVTDVWIRLNAKSGDLGWIRSDITDWFSHPTDGSVDVSMTPVGVPEEFDHLVVSLSLFADNESMQAHGVGLGDEVFITGLFIRHHGNDRNIPIVRVGNIACLDEEKIHTKEFGEIDAYLVEARSLGGLSGSPVFLNLGSVRANGEGLVHYKQPICLLFGLVHGHYDVRASLVDATDSNEDLAPERVNTGIAVVVPFHRIREVFELSVARFEVK